jgi:succinyl-diaminopimelate desuccinylase
MEYTRLWNLTETNRAELVDFAARLVQTPSLSGQEAGVAALIQAEMERLSYDKVWVDEAGNVVGCIEGGDGPSLMLNGHMDHVDAGDPAHWLHRPFGGTIHGGELWGRGAADMKGALAAMVYAGGLIKKLGMPLPADLYVSAVVQEEVGGLGARYLAKTLAVDRAVVGEASGNQLRRGHRGRIELNARFEGRSVHASMPDLGINPHFSMARFLQDLQDLEMALDPEYGSSTVTPTRVAGKPESANVTPATLDLVLDWRNIPTESPQEIVAKLSTLLAGSLLADCRGKIEVASKELASYTGFELSYLDVFPSFTTPADHDWLHEAHSILEDALSRAVEVGAWRFATDGGHFAAAGMTVLGFGPGDDAVVHTVEERLPIDQLAESVVGYAALSLV